MLCCSHQCGGGASAGSEVPDVEGSGCRLASQPLCNHRQPVRQQLDVEAQLRSLKIDEFLVWSQQVDEERRDSAFRQHVRHILVTWTMPAASAAVRKNDDPFSSFWNMQIALNLTAADRY